MNARDAALLSRWSEHRDAEAFNDLVSHYADMVYATCKRTLGNPADAEEITQECFLKLATGQIRIRTSLGGWLHSAATSLSINRLRSDARRRRREEIALAEIPTTTEPVWNDIQRFVDQAIAELPEDLRDPLIRHFLQRETHDQIAQDLNLTRSAVTKRVANGIECVRETLKKSGVIVTAAALAALASEHLAEAAPAALKASLGRLALSGAIPTAAAAATGMTMLTKTFAVVMLVMIAGAGITLAYNRLPDLASPHRQESVRATPVKVAAPTNSVQPGALPTTSAPAAAIAESTTSKTANVSGRVLDKETLQGIPDARVCLALADEFYTYVQTNERGEYRIEGMYPSTWKVYCLKANGYYTGIGGPERTEDNERTVKLEPGSDITGVDLKLGHGEGVTGLVVDTVGKPVGGAKVTATSGPINCNTAESRPDGTFLVTGFPPTVKLYVWAEKANTVSMSFGPYALPQEKRALDPVVLQPEAVVHGVLQDKAGKPLPGLDISAWLGGEGPYRELEVVSAADGRFELNSIPPGDVRFGVKRGRESVEVQDNWIVMATGQVMDDFALVCQVGGLTISGQVVDSLGNPLSEAMVQCDGQPYRVGEDGKFVLNNLEPRTYSLTAFHMKHLKSDSVEVKAGTDNVQLVMPDGISVEGRVVDANTGEPIPAYEVKACYRPEDIVTDDWYEKTENVDGAFKLTLGQLGDIYIAARAEGYALNHIDATVDGSQAVVQGVVIGLKPQADLRGKVHDAKGAPVVGALVFSGRSRRGADASYAIAKAGNDGEFTVSAQKLADDFITLYHPTLGGGQANLEPKHYAGALIDVTLPSGTSLVCTVTTNGVPAVNAAVSVWPAADYRDLTAERTHANGTCRFDGLLPEDYAVVIESPLPPQSNMETGGQEFGPRLEREVTLAPGQTTDLNVDFVTGDASITVEAKPPIKVDEMTLSIPNAESNQLYRRYEMSREEGDGLSYTFSNLPAGQATLMVRMSAGEPTATPRNSSRRYTFTLTPGAALHQELRADQEATFWGTVRPMPPNEEIMLRVLYGRVGPEDMVSNQQERSFYGAITVAPDGTFRMEGFQPGTYTLVPMIHSPQREEPEWLWASAVTVDLQPEGHEVNLQLPQ